jgi:Flp pilus assembly pilin Flp
MERHHLIATRPGHARARRLLRDQRGAGLLEYAILAGLIAIAAFMAFKGFGSSVSSVVGKQAETVTTINSTP